MAMRDSGSLATECSWQIGGLHLLASQSSKGRSPHMYCCLLHILMTERYLLSNAVEGPNKGDAFGQLPEALLLLITPLCMSPGRVLMGGIHRLLGLRDSECWPVCSAWGPHLDPFLLAYEHYSHCSFLFCCPKKSVILLEASLTERRLSFS